MKHSPFPFQVNTPAYSIHRRSFLQRSALLWLAFLYATGIASAQQPFITTWKTNNPGTSNSTSITIPTTGGGHNYEVDWNNDGTYDQSSITGNVTHNFGVAGTYTIRIRGTFPRIFFNNGGDRQKLLNIQQWGDVAWTSMNYAFYGCSNLNITATDLPNLSGVTNLATMFAACSALNGPANIGDWNTANVTNMTEMFFSATAFNQPIANWNTANVTNMSFMFYLAPAFNQPIANWNTANVTDMSFMFSGATAFNQSIGNWTLHPSVNLSSMLNNSGLDCDSYSATLIGWSSNPATPNGRTLGANGRQYGTNAVAARTNLDITKAWTFNGDAASGVVCAASLPAFTTTWKTNNPGTSNSTSITIPTTGSGYNYEVDWNNDGTYEQSNITGSVTHNFGVAGTYTIRLRGAFPRIYFNGGGDRQKLLEVQQWGDVAWASMNNAFHGCSNLNISATDLPNLSGVTDLSAMFKLCSALNGPANIDNWNTANVTNMNNMFESTATFNQPIGNWNTASVTNMDGMFAFTTVFNQPIGNWNTANVTDMSFVFYIAAAFNQPIANWNTANVISMYAMFADAAAFNQPIANWNTANVTNMAFIFAGATAFNRPIANWTLHPSVDLTGMLDNSGLDCDNYSATLIGWNNNPATPNGRTLGASGRQYGTNAVAARTNLDIAKAWTINGDAASGLPCPAPLPVEWLAFTGKVQDNNVLLTWQTAREQQNAGFHLEHSTDGLRWTGIGFVAGQGAATVIQLYSFLDEKPLPGINYYRLRQMDFNGNEDVSKVVSVDFPSLRDLINLVRVYPNPVSAGELHLLLPENMEEEVSVLLFSPTGYLLRSSTIYSGDNTLATNGLAAGIYALQVRNGRESIFKKIVVEH